MRAAAGLLGFALLGQQAEAVVMPFHDMDGDGEASAFEGSASSRGNLLESDGEFRSSKAFDTAVEAEVEKRLGEKLEEKMKFFPAMTSFGQLLQWNTSVAGPRVGPSKLPVELPNGRRIMSMHDMAGGYQELSDNDYLSMFKSWPLVDLFVYFSHCRIGVPPNQWTAMAHEHGRPAMGTLIFEGSNSEDSKIIKENREKVISQLVQVADHYGFDGWFVNIEGGQWERGDPEKFVGELKTSLKDKVGKRAQVIAYPYGPDDKMFQHADGVFMQYGWDESPASMHSVMEKAGERRHDVYMGTDSFGGLRGNDEPDPEHVKACAKSDVSLAVFAPGFTLEKGEDRKVSLLAVDYDERYWESIAKNFGRDVPSAGEWPVPVRTASQKHSLSEAGPKAGAPTNGAALEDPEMAVMKRYASAGEAAGANTASPRKQPHQRRAGGGRMSDDMDAAGAAGGVEVAW
eukprot:TRINITY_DN12908_c0_g1_i1.p1 TRINITY_DN12908_c0_g1~~TRINITY_DN12908_c0_g1_i1.p1  ORF type:complete len:458 (+),score=119.93 TRINITY_DN12908_c0_g1_i1:78-1451(+)